MSYPYNNQPPYAYGSQPPQPQGGNGYPAPPPTSGYGAPPPQQAPYGGGYGAPPQQPGGYGAQQSYYGGSGGGAPPPGPPHHQQHHHQYHQQGGYAQQPPPPPHGGGGSAYGYGAPPPPTHGGYGAPASAGNVYLGVYVPPHAGQAPGPPPPGFNAQSVVDAIRKATKGFGTDEKALINALAPLDAVQMDAVSRQFKSTVGKDLITVLEKETGGWFEACLRAKVLGPVGYDVWLVHRACDGAGTHEDILNEVLLVRTNAEIHTLKQAYHATYHQHLDKIVEAELSMKTKRMFVMALQGSRGDENAPVDGRMVEQDVHDLHAAARCAGTDEIKICGIMCQRSTRHLQAVGEAYYHRHRRTLADMINAEFSGHMKDGLSYIADTVLPGPAGVTRDAKMFEDAMSGAGTKDERLIYRIVRAHWDRPRFEEVKRAYAATQSRKGLKSRVEGETSGDYERFLVAVIGH